MKRHSTAPPVRTASSIRLLLPFLAMAVAFFLNVTALPLPILGAIKPPFMTMILYHWAIYRPAFVPPWLCFILGVFTDLLSGLPPGLNAIVFVLVQWLGQEQRRFLIAQPYVTIWAVFSLVLVMGHLIQWGLYGLISPSWPPMMPIAAQTLVGVFVFPFVSMILTGIHRALPPTDRDYR